MTPIQCDEKLLAHIFNHAYLQGSVRLEGNLFINTIGYLSQYIQRLRDEGELISPQMERIINAWSSLVHYERIISRPGVSKASLNETATSIVQAVKALRHNDFLLIPGGWRGIPSGHALVYAYHNRNGEIYFSVHNSGYGSDNHAKQSSYNKELYWPTLTYKIPPTQINNPFFIQINYRLLEAQVPLLHNKSDIGASYLYEELFTSFSYIGGALCDTQLALQSTFTAGQLSGVCAQHALHALLKSCMTQDEYRIFIYHFKNHALIDYWSLITTNGSVHDIKHHGQVIKAVRHQLRLLNLKSIDYPSRDLFDESIKREHKERLEAYLAYLKSSVRNATALEENPTVVEPTTPVRITIIPPQTTPQIQRIEHSQESPGPIRVIDTSNNLLGEMDELLNHCDGLIRQHKYHALFEQIEHFIMHLPLPDEFSSRLLPYYQSIQTKEDAFLFYQKMNCLQEHYFKSADALLGATSILPRMLLVKLSIILVTLHINTNHRLNTAEGIHFYSFFYYRFWILNKRSAPYMSTNTPEFDARYKRLVTLLTSAQRSIDTPIKYYQSIVDTETQLKRALEQQYAEEYANETIAVDNRIHTLLQAQGYTSLYYLITHPQKLDQGRFAPLLSKIAQQNEIEALIVLFANRVNVRSSPIDPLQLHWVEKPSNVMMEIKLSSNLHKPELRVDSTQRTMTHITAHSNLLHCTRGLSNTASGTALIEPMISHNPNENTYQINPWLWLRTHSQNKIPHAISRDEIAYREFFLLRLSPLSQIYQTLDYFNRNPDKLKSEEVKVYVEANLFEPPLLLRLLSSPKESEQLFKKLDCFVRNGLKYHEKNNLLSQDSLFYIRLYYLVIEYAYQYDPQQFEAEKNRFYKEINRQLAIQTDPLIKATLHRYRFLCTILCATDAAPTQEVLRNTLISGIYVSSIANPRHCLDKNTLFQYQCAHYQWMRLILNHHVEVDKALIIELFRHLNLTLENEREVHIVAQYPLFKVLLGDQVLYVIHAEQCLVFQEAMATQPTPIDILSHPITRYFGMDTCYSSFISADGLIIELKDSQTSLRFIKRLENYSIQKKWVDTDGRVSWYELQALSLEQSQYWQIPLAPSNPTLGKILTQRDALLWVCEDPPHHFLLCNGLEKPPYYGASGQLTDGRLTLCHPTTWIHKRLKSFEAPEFIDVWEDSQEQKYNIDLSRYGLHLHATQEGIFMLYNDKKYALTDTADFFSSSAPHLLIQHGTQRHLIIPIQRFINTKKRSAHNEYYELHLDTAHSIANAILKELLGDNTLQCWQFSQTERCFIYTVTDGNVQPQTPEEALYLCYIYLGTHQEDKAWAILEDCDKRLGGLSGTYQELEILSWIVNDLPYHLDKKEKPNARISSPPYVACTLKALTLFTQYARSGKKIPFPKVTSPALSANARLEAECIKKVQLFYDTLSISIYQLLSRLQPMRRELPADYLLTDVELQSLLDFYHQDNKEDEDSPIALGALGYEWVELRFKILHQEARHLQTKKERRSLSPYEQRRMEELEAFIREHEGVRARTSKLEYRPINLSIPPDLSIGYSATRLNFWANSREFFRASNEIKQREAMSALRIDIAAQDFDQHLIDYIHIITNKNNARRAQLMHFCKATLITYRHIPLKRDPTGIVLLCNMLYRIQDCDANDLAKYTFIEQIFEHAKGLNPPPIEVPELLDETSELLCSAQTLWDSIEPIEEATPPQIHIDAAQVKIQDWFTDALINLKNNWQLIEQEAQATQDNLVEDLDNQPPFDTLPKKEAQAGFVSYQALQNKKKLAIDALASNEQRSLIEEACNTALERLIGMQEALKANIMALAREGSDDRLIQQRREIDELSGKERAADFTTLLNLYFHNDTQRYAKKTGLSNAKINHLHEQLTLFVAQGIQIQLCQRITAQLEQIKGLSEEEIPWALFNLAKILCSENHVDVVTDPALSLFQYYSNLLLYPQQEQALKRLLSTSAEGTYHELIEQILMGGGKTKITIPTLAQKKAHGSNLVIVEVPKALLRTNYVDLKASASLLFQQEVMLFEFHRNSDASVKGLNTLYDQLTQIMIRKGFVITTGASIMSLELKYLELLYQKPEDLEDTEDQKLKFWQKQVTAAERLLLLLKHRGDVLIDEVHHGLLLKNELNYTLGDARAIPHSITHHALALYRFFSQVYIDTMTLHEAIIQRQSLITDTYRNKAINALIEALMTHEHSPLSETLLTLAPNRAETKALIQKYLLNQGSDIPECILRTKKPIKEQLAFYKEQITHLLPFTLKRQQGEHYGPSQLTSRTAPQKMIARPYIANNVPSEMSEFGNYLEVINYTIQSALITGISKELLKIALSTWIKEAKLEDNPDNSAIAAQYAQMTQGLDIPFSLLNPEDDAQLEHVHKHIKHHITLIFTVLQSHILPEITTNPLILRSNAYSHVAQLHSCQGMSGTPSNHTTFDMRLRLSEASSRGTEPLIIKAIQDKRPCIYSVDFTDTHTFIEQILSPYNRTHQIRAIIDVNASFKGISNLSVATALCAYIFNHAAQLSIPEPLRYVLYFNEHNQLCALRIQDIKIHQEPIVLDSSDPQKISNRLNCTPGAYFTYYDQAHTTGTDIKQSPNSKGLTLIGSDTHIQHFLQGAMRLRALIEGNQSIDIIVPTMLKEHSFEQLVQGMILNAQQQLQEDNAHACTAQMHQLIRSDLMSRLLSFSGDDAINKKHTFLIQTQRYFIQTQSPHFWELYGSLTSNKRTTHLLCETKENLLRDWQALMSDIGAPLSEQDIQLMQQRMEAIITRAQEPGFCIEEQNARAENLSREVEIQQQQEVQVAVLEERHLEQYNPILEPEPYTLARSYKTLQELCEELGDACTPQFDPNIRASSNFYKSYKDQKPPYIGLYLKSVHALLFEPVDNGALQCTLLSQTECANFIQHCIDRKPSAWICTTQDTILAGTPPDGVEQDPVYRSIIEQIRYFNGEFNLIKAPFYWLKNQPEEKIRFYKTYLLHCRESNESDINAVAAQCSEMNKIFNMIMRTPWVDFSNHDWSDYYSEEDEDLVLIQNLAGALKEASSAWKEDKLDASHIARAYNLTIKTAGYLSVYATRLSALSQCIKEVEAACCRVKEEGLSFALEGYSHTKITLEALCPSLKSLPNNANGNSDYHYQLVAQLRDTIPLCAHHLILTSACAYNPKITPQEVIKLLALLNERGDRYGLARADATDDATRHIAYGLLSNEASALTQEQVIQIADSVIEYDKQTCLCLAKHPKLPESQFIKVLSKARALACATDVLTVFITQKPNVSLTQLHELINQNELTEQHIIEILKQEEPLGGAILERLKRHQLSSDKTKERIIARLESEARLCQLQKAPTPELIQAALSNETGSLAIYSIAAANPLTNEASLIIIAHRAQNLGRRFIESLLNREDMKNGLRTRSVIPILINKDPRAVIEHIEALNTSSHALQVIAEIATGQDIFTATLTRAQQFPNNEEKNQILHALIQNASFSHQRSIQSIIPDADARTIKAILSSKSGFLNAHDLSTILNRNDLDEETYQYIARHRALCATVTITKLIQCAPQASILSILLERQPCILKDEHRRLILEQTAAIEESVTQVTLLRQLAAQNQNLCPEILTQLLSRTDLSEENEAQRYKNELLLTQINNQFTRFSLLRHIQNQEHINDYINTIRAQRAPQIINAEQLNALTEEVAEVYNAQNSPAVHAIYATVKRLQEEKPSFFYSNAAKKAQSILDALKQVPLKEQSQILTGTTSEIRAVQSALAAHRNIFMQLYQFFCRLFQKNDPNTPFPLQCAATSYIQTQNDAQRRQENRAHGIPVS